MYGQTDTAEKQKKKIIIISLVMGIIIIVLIGVLINAITSKNKNTQVANTTETTLVREDSKSEPEKVEENTKSDDSKTEESKAEDTKLEPVANTTTTVTPSSDVKTENLPQTGASGVLGLALLAGSATTYAFSKKRK